MALEDDIKAVEGGAEREGESPVEFLLGGPAFLGHVCNIDGLPF